MSNVIMLSNVRLSFPALAEARISKMFPNNPPMYGADFIMAPTHPGFAEFMKEYAAIASAAFKETAPQIMNMINNDKRARCFGKGEEKVNQTTFKMYDGYEGNVWISTKSKDMPQMIRADGKPAANTMEAQELARKMYGGCYVNAVVRPWARTNQNKGLSCDLVAIQFAADGEPFGEGSVDVAPMFGAVQGAAAPAPAGVSFPSFLA